uniref:Uncharacterized protein n=1 Tax=Anopheles atroparvus TaxID=41427 RepID=A0A182J5U4_ANOAO
MASKQLLIAGWSVELDVVNGLVVRSVGHLGNRHGHLGDGGKCHLSDGGVHLGRSLVVLLRRSLVVLLHRSRLVVLHRGRLVVLHWLRGEHLGDGRGGVHLGDRGNNLGNRDDGLHHLVALDGLAADDGVESVVVIGGVVNHAAVSISIDQRVLALNDISMTFLLLALDITGVVIVDIVGELVLGGRIGVLDVLDGLDQRGLDEPLGRIASPGLITWRFINQKTPWSLLSWAMCPTWSSIIYPVLATFPDWARPLNDSSY